MAETDLSKVIGLIMENPKLIEEIKNLAAKDSDKESEKEIEATSEYQSTNSTSETAEVLANNGDISAKIRRHELLSALKPYVSEERSKAIDSMMSIADILDMMRSK